MLNDALGIDAFLLSKTQLANVKACLTSLTCLELLLSFDVPLFQAENEVALSNASEMFKTLVNLTRLSIRIEDACMVSEMIPCFRMLDHLSPRHLITVLVLDGFWITEMHLIDFLGRLPFLLQVELIS